MDKWFHLTLYNGYNYLYMPGLKLIHAWKRGSWYWFGRSTHGKIYLNKLSAARLPWWPCSAYLMGKSGEALVMGKCVHISIVTGVFYDLTHCSPVTPYGDIDIGQHRLTIRNGLLPNSTKPLPELMLTCYQQGRVGRLCLRGNVFTLT